MEGRVNTQAFVSMLERPTLSARVVRHLLSLIKSEKLRPSDQVPSEIQIGRDLQISRGAVREAYRSLAALGILEIEGGRRPRLRRIDPQVLMHVFDYGLITEQVRLEHVLETRRALELQTAQFAARYATDAQRQELRNLAAQLRADGANHARRVASDMAIHNLIAEASDNPLNSLILHSLRSPVEASSRMHFDENRSEAELVRLIEAHEAIVERICAADPVGAATAMSYHFDLSLVQMKRQLDEKTRVATSAGTNPSEIIAEMQPPQVEPDVSSAA